MPHPDLVKKIRVPCTCPNADLYYGSYYCWNDAACRREENKQHEALNEVRGRNGQAKE